MDNKLVHIYNAWNPKINSARLRVNNAARTWKEFYKIDKYGVIITAVTLQNVNKNSSNLGESKVTPFFKDVINYAISSNPGHKLFLYTNADTSLVKDASESIRSSLRKWGCGYSHRIDFTKNNYPKRIITRSNLIEMIQTSNWSAGCDIFFFTREWWNKYGNNLPEALIGFEGWDACVMSSMLQHGLKEPVKWVSYHQQHNPYWKKIV